MAAPKKAIKRDAGDAAVMVQRVFPGAMVVQWGRRTYLAPPPAKEEVAATPATVPTPRKKERGADNGPRLF